MKDEKEFRRKEILRMVVQIEQQNFIDMIYGVVRRLYREENVGADKRKIEKQIFFRKRTIEILYEIDNVDILVKVFTCAKTLLEISREKKGEKRRG